VAVGRQSYLTNGCYACHGLEAQPSQIFAHARLKAPLRHFTELQTEAVQA
jgi:Cytochrome c